MIEPLRKAAHGINLILIAFGLIFVVGIASWIFNVVYWHGHNEKLVEKRLAAQTAQHFGHNGDAEATVRSMYTRQAPILGWPAQTNEFQKECYMKHDDIGGVWGEIKPRQWCGISFNKEIIMPADVDALVSKFDTMLPLVHQAGFDLSYAEGKGTPRKQLIGNLSSGNYTDIDILGSRGNASIDDGYSCYVSLTTNPVQLVGPGKYSFMGTSNDIGQTFNESKGANVMLKYTLGCDGRATYVPGKFVTTNKAKQDDIPQDKK